MDRRMIRRYRWGVLAFAAALLAVAGMLTFFQNTDVVSGEKSVSDGAIYPFTFLTQPSGTDKDSVYYRDSFFSEPNLEYDHELGRASLALAMTAFDKKHVTEFLNSLGFADPALYRYDQTGDEDKVALALTHKETREATIVAVAIRGGKYGDEWGSNGRIGYNGESLGYHYGFHKAAEDAIVQLKDYVADNDVNLAEAKIWITGFSRGGAVANVMGAMLTGQVAGYDAGAARVTISPDNLFDYTFASPSTVSESFVTGDGENESRIYNIVNPLDIVTHLPMYASGISKTAKSNSVRYNWDYMKYGMTINMPAQEDSAQMQMIQLLENALAFATRNESVYVEKTQEQIIIPALKKAMGKGADVSKRNVGVVLVQSLPGVTVFLKNELEKLDLGTQIYVAALLSGKKSIRLEKEHWPETYWGWMTKVDVVE